MIAPHLYSEELLFDNRLRRWAVLSKHFKTLRISKCLQMTVIRMLSVCPGQATTVTALLRRNPLLSHITWACPINEITNVSRNLYLLLSWPHSTTSIIICQPVFFHYPQIPFVGTIHGHAHMPVAGFSKAPAPATGTYLPNKFWVCSPYVSASVPC